MNDAPKPPFGALTTPFRANMACETAQSLLSHQRPPPTSMVLSSQLITLIGPRQMLTSLVLHFSPNVQHHPLAPINCFSTRACCSPQTPYLSQYRESAHLSPCFKLNRYQRFKALGTLRLVRNWKPYETRRTATPLSPPSNRVVEPWEDTMQVHLATLQYLQGGGGGGTTYFKNNRQHVCMAYATS